MRTPNAALYREMSAPFETRDAGNDAVSAFFTDVEEARKKHRISDVIVVVEVGMMSDGEETRGAAALYLGDPTKAIPMIAAEYGKQRGIYEEQLAQLIARSRRGK